MNWLIKNFLRGLVLTVPIVFTVWVIYQAFITIDRFFGFRAPGMGILVIVAGSIAIGALASNYVGRKVFYLTEAIFTRAPLVRLVYASIKDLLEAFVGERRRFNRPVAVALNENVSALGFVTRESVDFAPMQDRVAVYFPFSYSVAGIVLTVPASCITPLEADSSSVMAFIVSGGISRV